MLPIICLPRSNVNLKSVIIEVDVVTEVEGVDLEEEAIEGEESIVAEEEKVGGEAVKEESIVAEEVKLGGEVVEAKRMINQMMIQNGSIDLSSAGDGVTIAPSRMQSSSFDPI